MKVMIRVLTIILIYSLSGFLALIIAFPWEISLSIGLIIGFLITILGDIYSELVKIRKKLDKK